MNVKVVERLYREERLWLRRTKRKKIPREGREGAWCPVAANQRWSLDCQHRLNFPQKCRSKIPHLHGSGDQPGSVICRSVFGFWRPSAAFRRRWRGDWGVGADMLGYEVGVST